MAKNSIPPQGGAGLAIDRDTMECIKDAVLLGLEAWGEVDKVTRRFDTHRALGLELPRDVRPHEISSETDTTARFATALRLIEQAIGSTGGR